MVDSSLCPTPIIDADHPSVAAFVERHAGSATSDRERAVRLYYAVRDEIRYDPYRLDLTPAAIRASWTLSLGYGWCVPKAALLTACCRAAGIPAKVGYADVKNHLSTARLRERMGSDVFYWHGYSAIRLDDRWVKATPAFNIELCEKFRIRPLEFDGTEDSIYHPFDLDGRAHMEYLAFRGEYDEVPLGQMLATYVTEYRSATYESWDSGADFERDAEAENADG
ncbi:MAG: transglutaminase family protein [Polyangiales bacterium]